MLNALQAFAILSLHPFNSLISGYSCPYFVDETGKAQI